jgi:hypothetical protein
MRLTLNRSVRQKIGQQIAGEAIAIECCRVRDLTEDDTRMQERGTIPRARLDFNSTTSAEVSRVPSARGKVTA